MKDWMAAAVCSLQGRLCAALMYIAAVLCCCRLAESLGA